MDPVTFIDNALVATGYGVYVPVVLAVVGLASAVATVYPPTWKGAATIHKFALLVGKAAPAQPAVTPLPPPVGAK